MVFKFWVSSCIKAASWIKGLLLKALNSYPIRLFVATDSAKYVIYPCQTGLSAFVFEGLNHMAEWGRYLPSPSLHWWSSLQVWWPVVGAAWDDGTDWRENDSCHHVSQLDETSDAHLDKTDSLVWLLWSKHCWEKGAWRHKAQKGAGGCTAGWWGGAGGPNVCGEICYRY